MKSDTYNFVTAIALYTYPDLMTSIIILCPSKYATETQDTLNTINFLYALK
jgi:hypothetical protein